MSICSEGDRLAAHKTDARGCGTEVRAVLALMVLEALDPRQSCGPVETELSLTSHSSMAVSSQSQWGGQPGPSPTSRPVPNYMAPAKSKGPAPSIPSSASTRHPALGAQPASYSLCNACSQRERQPFCPKPQPPQGRVLPARDSSQEKNHPKGTATSTQTDFSLSTHPNWG